jgi:7-keto-8-aminopelargonate synthetase-like enzyme
MDGDDPPLAAIVQLCQQYGAWLLIDDAHATGTRGPGGRGSLASAGISPVGLPIVVLGTLSKALGSQGGFIAGPAPILDWMANIARAYLFDTGLAPANAAAALAALQILHREPHRVTHLHQLCQQFAARLHSRGTGVPPVSAPQNEPAPLNPEMPQRRDAEMQNGEKITTSASSRGTGVSPVSAPLNEPATPQTQMPQRRDAEMQRGHDGNPGTPVLPPTALGPIFPLHLGHPQAALDLARHLETHGQLTIPIRPPTVPPGTSRVRIVITTAHQPHQIDQLAKTISAAPTSE